MLMFNYRGYNLSNGTPSPVPIKADAELLVEYLRNERHVEKLIIHGESIGGMIACHVASSVVPPPNMLVADRTFSSLDATAARLMGMWAYHAVRWLTLWRTDVVDDFLRYQRPF